MGEEKEVKTCPECGKTTAEYRKHMFTGLDAYVRDHGDWIQCKNCGYEGLSKEMKDNAE